MHPVVTRTAKTRMTGRREFILPVCKTAGNRFSFIALEESGLLLLREPDGEPEKIKTAAIKVDHLSARNIT
jgi:hypothetical protein